MREVNFIRQVVVKINFFSYQSGINTSTCESNNSCETDSIVLTLDKISWEKVKPRPAYPQKRICKLLILNFCLRNTF